MQTVYIQLCTDSKVQIKVKWMQVIEINTELMDM